MSSSPRTIPPNVFLIVDHLDSVLASAEELRGMTIALPAQSGCDGTSAPAASLKAFADRARALELSIMSRALQARARARELRQPHRQLKVLMSLFVGGTAPLADAVAELGDPTSVQFDTADCPLSYLRSRGIIAPDLGSLAGIVQLEIGDDFQVARRIALGPLMDLASQFLETLGVSYDLFRMDDTLPGLADDGGDDRAPPSPADETQTGLA